MRLVPSVTSQRVECSVGADSQELDARIIVKKTLIKYIFDNMGPLKDTFT